MVEVTLAIEKLHNLKKVLAMLEIASLKRVVKIDDNPIEIEKLCFTANGLITAIEQEMIFPSRMLKEDKSIIDFSPTPDYLKSLINDKSFIDLNESKILELLPLQDYFNNFKSHWEKHNSYWVDIRKTIAVILDYREQILNMIKAYVQHHTSTPIRLAKLIELINALMKIDFAFNLTEYGEDIFYPEESPIITGVSAYD